ncbi:MAG: flavohemoglobin expression-modulating QEGLA motif protein [Actinomycetota bacterium]|nr:flavohemoglobin expression-modulating QEGLA motif protein [Actinomycetota bacterium]
MTIGADSELAAIAQQLDLLLNLTPVNSAPAWEDFERSGFAVAPTFVYRDLQLDVDALHRRLGEVPIEDVAEPLLAGLLHAKRRELTLQLRLIEMRGSPRFLETSVDLYGGVTEALLDRALGILSALPPMPEEDGHVSPAEMRAHALDEVAHYCDLDRSFECEVEVRDDVVDLMVHRGKLLIGASAAVRRKRVAPLLQHELGTHVVTYFNATKQPLQLLRLGLDAYEETQEGLAVIAEYAVAGLDAQRMRLLAARVVAVHRVVEGRSFVEIFDELRLQHGFAPRTAWAVTARVARSGGFTKDVIYLRGLVNLLDYLKAREPLDPLLVGKMALVHVPAVKDLIQRGFLRSPAMRPRWMELGAHRLGAIDADTTILDLVTT